MTPIAAELRLQAGICRDMGSPFMGRLLDTLADGPWTGALGLDDWPGDPAEGRAQMALRLAGALHRLVLSGACLPLAAAYPPGDAPLPPALDRAVADHAGTIGAALAHPPQTNEVGRSAMLIPGLHALLAEADVPVLLSELGASAGLNLNLDAYALVAGATRYGPTDPALTLTPDWTGPAPVPRSLRILDRRGVDLSPVDVGDPDARFSLRAFVWPDQPVRAACLAAAMAVPPAPVDRADAADWLPARLAAAPEGAWHVVLHTIAWQYFPPATQARLTTALADAGARATPTRRLAHLSVERDATPGSAAVNLTAWPGGTTRLLARADFHGSWVDWRAP